MTIDYAKAHALLDEFDAAPTAGGGEDEFIRPAQPGFNIFRMLNDHGYLLTDQHLTPLNLRQVEAFEAAAIAALQSSPAPSGTQHKRLYEDLGDGLWRDVDPAEIAPAPSGEPAPVVTWVNDASNENDRRMFVDGQQWAKVSGWDKKSLDARCDALEAALTAAPVSAGDDELRAKLALIHDLAKRGADKAGCDGWRAQEMCRQIQTLADLGGA